jgi:hypothetical protein
MYFGWRHNIKGLRSPKAAYHGLPIEQEKIDRLARDAEQLLKEIESLVPKNQSASINKLNGKPN